MGASLLSKNLHLTIQGVLKPLGFARVGSTWYFDAPDAIGVINLQRSMWGAAYYINVGIYVKVLGVDERPKEYECHFRDRIERFLDNSDFKELRFDDAATDVGEADSALLTGLVRAIAPIVQSLTSIDALREFILGHRGGLIRKNLPKFLGLADDRISTVNY